MAHLETQQEYLYRHGVGSDTPVEKIEALKKAYRKYYLIEYRKNYKTQRVNLSLSPREVQELSHVAKLHHQKLAPFTKMAALAYIRNQYIQPDDEAIDDLTRELNAIGNNLNQVVRHIRMTNRPDAFYEDMNREFGDLKEEILQFVKAPPKPLLISIQEALEDPITRTNLITHLKKMIDDYQE